MTPPRTEAGRPTGDGGAGGRALVEEVDALFALRPDLVADPYPLYRRLVTEAPVLERGDALVVSGFEQVNAIMADPKRFSSGNRQSFGQLHRRGVAPEDEERLEYLVTFEMALTARMDDPEHARNRKMVTKPFTPRSVSLLEEAVRSLVDDQLARLDGRERGPVDLRADFADHVPINVITDMFGVPEADRSLVRERTDALARWRGSPAALRDGYDAAVGLRRYVTTTLLGSAEPPSTELMRAVMDADLGPEQMSFRLVGLILAGAETTTNLLLTGAMLLLQDGRTWRQLHDQPELVPNAVEELIRLVSPVQFVQRFAAEDTTVDGVPLAAGGTALLMLGAANRDPNRFPDPDRLDVTRPGIRQHLGFGYGIHLCLGATLARLEAAIAFDRLTSRYPDARLAEPLPEWRPNLQLRGLTELQVLLE